MADTLIRRTLEGAAAGLAGTAALQAVALPGQKYLPDYHPPETEDPASFMLWQAEKHLPRRTWLAIPRTAETAAGFGLSFGYGATFGALAWHEKSRVDGQCDGSKCRSQDGLDAASSMRTYGLLSDITFGVAVAGGLTAGAVAWLWPRASGRPQVSLGPQSWQAGVTVPW